MSNTISCTYNIMVSDTFNRQVIKRGAISANMGNYSYSSISLAVGSTESLSVSNLLLIESDGPYSLTQGTNVYNFTGLCIMETSGTYTIAPTGTSPVNLNLIYC